MDDRVVPPLSAGQQQADAPGFLDDARALLSALGAQTHDSLELAVLETRLAAWSFVAMLAAGLGVAALVLTSWLALLAVLVLLLIAAGVPPAFAALAGATANILLAVPLAALMRRSSRHLGWAATRRSLRNISRLGNGNNPP